MPEKGIKGPKKSRGSTEARKPGFLVDPTSIQTNYQVHLQTVGRETGDSCSLKYRAGGVGVLHQVLGLNAQLLPPRSLGIAER